MTGPVRTHADVLPAVMVAATHSGAGKTTVTAIVSRALRERGLVVQPFKLGPDFIDPAYHGEAAGRTSINLDLWLMGEQGVRDGFRRWARGADIAVIEAMGALYDGADGTERGSAAQVAKLLGVPVVVVLDVWGMTRTAAALLDGLRAFDPDVEIAGCVLNRVGSAEHRRMVLDALPSHLRRLVLGAIERRPELEIPERHLGLVTVEENATSASRRNRAQTSAAEQFDLDRLLAIAGTTRMRPAPLGDPPPVSARPAVARMAVAQDEAFSFYYEDNLRLLRDAGFQLVPFRPTADPQLPTNVEAVYLGGGYPESFAAALAANVSLATELRRCAAAGMPIYAECGGLLYLARSLTGADGTWHAMSGVLPIDVAMDPDHLAIRYVEVHTRDPSPLGPAATTARGQEFHQSRILRADIAPTLYDITTSDGQTFRDGYHHRNVVASYIHLHLVSNPQIATNLFAGAHHSGHEAACAKTSEFEKIQAQAGGNGNRPPG